MQLCSRKKKVELWEHLKECTINSSFLWSCSTVELHLWSRVRGAAPNTPKLHLLSYLAGEYTRLGPFASMIQYSHIDPSPSRFKNVAAERRQVWSRVDFIFIGPAHKEDRVISTAVMPSNSRGLLTKEGMAILQAHHDLFFFCQSKSKSREKKKIPAHVLGVGADCSKTLSANLLVQF